MTNRGDEPGTPAHKREGFEARLEKALSRGKAKPSARLNETSAFGIATRLVAELVAGLVVGGGLGWFLDRWLGTSPWLLIVFFALGAVAGISNVFRAARQMNAIRTPEETQKSDDRSEHDRDKGDPRGR